MAAWIQERSQIMSNIISPTLGMSLSDLDVLVVDDSAKMRHLVRVILQSFGVATIRQARDGTAALAEINARCPSVIISDWEMAPMNGLEFIHQVRSVFREPLCLVPIIVLTGHASKPLIQKAFDAGATQLLVKPVTPANVLQRLNWVLDDDRPFKRVGNIYRQDMPIDRPQNGPAIVPEAQSDEIWALD